MTGPPTHVTLQVARDVASVREVREWLSVNLSVRTELSENRIEDASLMVGELITNVIRHTSSIPVVSLTADDALALVEVHDDDPTPPEVRPKDATRVGGNGLRIVQAWSRTWGCFDGPGAGKTVWFTVG